MIINLNRAGQFCAGLGDCVFWAWLAEGHPGQVSFFAKDGPREMLEMFGQVVHAEPQPDMIDPSDAYTRELNDLGRLSRMHYCCRHLGIEVKWARPKLETNVDINPRRIGLCPHANFNSRRWPIAYWNNLNWLLLDAGYEVIFQLAFDDPALGGRGPSMAWWGGSLYDTARRLASCALVVGNDSMPAHLAGTLGRPTLALMGPTKPTVFSHIPEVECIYTNDLECVGCHFGVPYRVGCDHMCEALARVGPSEILKEIKKRVPLVGGQP